MRSLHRGSTLPVASRRLTGIFPTRRRAPIFAAWSTNWISPRGSALPARCQNGIQLPRLLLVPLHGAKFYLHSRRLPSVQDFFGFLLMPLQETDELRMREVEATPVEDVELFGQEVRQCDKGAQSGLEVVFPFGIEVDLVASHLIPPLAKVGHHRLKSP